MIKNKEMGNFKDKMEIFLKEVGNLIKLMALVNFKDIVFLLLSPHALLRA